MDLGVLQFCLYSEPCHECLPYEWHFHMPVAHKVVINYYFSVRCLDVRSSCFNSEPGCEHWSACLSGERFSEFWKVTCKGHALIWRNGFNLNCEKDKCVSALCIYYLMSRSELRVWQICVIDVRKRFWQPKLNERADLWTNMSEKGIMFWLCARFVKIYFYSVLVVVHD